MRTPILLAALVSGPLAGSLAHAAPVERRLHVGQAEASSYDKNGWNRFEENYLPLYVADDDPKTAWTEGAAGPGAGEWIRLHHSTMQGATKLRLKIRNGYQKSDKLFLANARAQKIAVKLLPGGATVEATLKDAQGWQEVVVEQPAGELSGVELKAISIYPGKKYEDLCISDVQLYVTATTADNPGYEKTVYERVLKWKADRVAAAETFKKARAERPLPIASQYQVARDHETPRDDCRDPFCEVAAQLTNLDAAKASSEEQAAVAFLKNAMAQKLAGWKAIQLVPRGPALPNVDGACQPSMTSCEFDVCTDPLMPIAALPLTSNDTFDVLEVKSELPADAALTERITKDKGCHGKTPKLYAWAQRTDGKVKGLLVAQCGMVEGREGTYAHASVELFAYDDAGLLRSAAVRNAAATYAWEPKPLHISGGRFANFSDVGTWSEVKEVAKAP